MSLNITANIIKITLLSVSILSILNAAEVDEAGNSIVSNAVIPFKLNPQAQEFKPRAFTTDWAYLNQVYPKWIYPKDMKATKAIKKRYKELEETINLGNPYLIVSAYLALGDAHMNHQYDAQMYYYKVAMDVGCIIGDSNSIKRSYVALGNMMSLNQQYIKSIEYYYQAFKLTNEGCIEDLAQKKLKQIKSILHNNSTRESLTPDQIKAVKTFFPRLASFYLN
jgi:hypothetical protein